MHSTLSSTYENRKDLRLKEFESLHPTIPVHEFEDPPASTRSPQNSSHSERPFLIRIELKPFPQFDEIENPSNIQSDESDSDDDQALLGSNIKQDKYDMQK